MDALRLVASANRAGTDRGLQGPLPIADDLHLPPIYCPIAPAAHPCAHRVDQRALHWLEWRAPSAIDRARSRLEETDCGALVARLFPYGTEKALETITKLHYWGFALDDIAERLAIDGLRTVADHHLGMMRILEVPGSAVLADDPVAHAFREIHADIGELTSPAVRRRWVDLSRGFAAAALSAATYRQVAAVPSPDVLTVIRPAEAGAFSYGIGLIEVAGGFEVPAEYLELPEVRALIDITSVLLAWDNDIYSVRRELEHGVHHINLVTALTHHQRLDARSAMATAIRMRNRAMWCYLRRRDRFLTATADETLHRYVRGLDHQIRGNLDWGLTITARYRDPVDDPLLLALWDQPTDHLHTDDLTEPLELPSIRWWWDSPIGPR